MSKLILNSVEVLRQDVALLAAITSISDVVMVMARDLPHESRGQAIPMLEEMMANIKDATQLIGDRVREATRETQDASGQ